VPADVLVLGGDTDHRDVGSGEVNGLNRSFHAPRHAGPHRGKVGSSSREGDPVFGYPFAIFGIERSHSAPIVCIPGVAEDFDEVTDRLFVGTREYLSLNNRGENGCCNENPTQYTSFHLVLLPDDPAEYNTIIMPFATGDLVAIDTHVHIEPDVEDNAADLAARKYFGDTGVARGRNELADYYRSRKIGCVVFSVDERLTGRPQVSNDDVATFAEENSDIIMAFASVDPTRGAEALTEARRLIQRGVKGFKLHPPLQQFFPNDKMAYPFYEVIAEARLPVIFHTGHSGIGTGMPGGGGIRLKYGNPMDIDDVAVDFPDMPIIMAHPSFPWQDEAISVCLHKPQVYIDLSGWSPKYFSPVLIQYANTLLKKKMLFGSDFPLITPDRWLADFEKIGIKDEVRPLILKENAIRLFGI
jgi:predicted TIM-barrel fold metal-dependent hydrolase